jgi:hypothetical protein
VARDTASLQNDRVAGLLTLALHSVAVVVLMSMLLGMLVLLPLIM